MVSDVGPLTPEEMLSRAAANVKSGNTTKNQSAVQKLLAERDTPLEDTVDLSPVQKILQKQKAEAEKIENYFDSDDYLKLKISQLRGQLAIYSTLPGLDPNGAVVGGIEAEIKDIIAKQQEKIQASTAESAAAQEKLAEQQAQQAKDAELTSAEDLLARVRGEQTTEPLSKEVQALLDKAKKGSTVNTTA